MSVSGEAIPQTAGILQRITASAGRFLISLAVPVVAFLVMWQGFIFLRGTEAPPVITVIVAIIWGVGGVALLYALSNWLVEKLPPRWTRLLQPYVFVGPALIILGWYLVLPTVRTFVLSFFNSTSEVFVQLDNYIFAFSDPAMRESFGNNLLWLVLGTGLSVCIGLLIAVLADRTRFESVAKALIFLPMAISFVGASVIWRFVFAFKPIGQEQIGLLNGIVTTFGADPIGWLIVRPWNNFFLIAIFIWMQTGFAMVLFSAAIKGVPEDLLEAARIDGANELQAFFRITIPYIRGTILTVSTTIIIVTLKIFDIVFVMTNGNLGTEVMASQFYKQLFKFQNFGRGSAVAIVMLIVVIPVMWYNLRRFREEEAF